VVYVLALITLIPVFNTLKISLSLAILYFIFFIILFAVALILAFITKYAIAFIVLKNKSLTDSIISAWTLFKNNWLVSLEMTFILFAISIIFSLAIILSVMIAAIPMALLFILGLWFNWFFLYVLANILFIVLALAIVVIGGSFLTVFQTTAWVHLFTQLNSKAGPESKLERVFSRVL